MSVSKRILVVCGTGAATSTVAAEKVKNYCESIGVKAEIIQCKAAEAKGKSEGMDLIVSTTRLPKDFDIPVVFAVSLLTGIDPEDTYEKIKNVLLG